MIFFSIVQLLHNISERVLNIILVEVNNIIIILSQWRFVKKQCLWGHGLVKYCGQKKTFHHRQVDLYLCDLPNLLILNRQVSPDEKKLEKQIEIKHKLDITTW